MMITGASLCFPGCQWQWASTRDSGSTWKSLASAGGIANRLGTKAETMVIAWPVFNSGCGSKGGRTKSTSRLYVTGSAQARQRRALGFVRYDFSYVSQCILPYADQKTATSYAKLL